MSDIVLSAGVRSNLLQLQRTSDLISNTQTKLATGKRVNSAVDNPINFFTAQGLSNRASDLTALLDSMSNGINTIQAANNGLTSITKLVQSAQALISQAQQTSDTTTRASLATQFGVIQTQINTLAGDSGFNGINLLKGNNLTVTLNETGSSSVTITGVTYDSAGLGINNATNNWAAAADITAAATDLNGALTKLRSQAQAFGSSLSTVQIRQDFTKAMVNTLQTGSDSLTLADSNEEGANLLALQTRQELSTTALSLASLARQAVLRLFQYNNMKRPEPTLGFTNSSMALVSALTRNLFTC
jgi:flagellin-like hook-associated protein FlgL